MADPTAHDFLQGTPFGDVYPPVVAQPLPSVDPRTTALRMLRLYVSELTFFRPGALVGDVRGPALPFIIAEDRFYIEAAGSADDLVFPCIVVVSADEADYNNVGLTSYVDETTRDVYSKGTVLQVQYEQQETIVLEMWASSKPERRSMVAGLQVALNPTEQMYGIRFVLPDYFNQTVCFTPLSHTLDDMAAVNNRRIARMKLEMRFNVVALVPYTELQPQVAVEVRQPDDPTDDGVEMKF